MDGGANAEALLGLWPFVHPSIHPLQVPFRFPSGSLQVPFRFLPQSPGVRRGWLRHAGLPSRFPGGPSFPLEWAFVRG